MHSRCPAALCLFALVSFICSSTMDAQEAKKEQPKENRELHVVGLYEGFTRSGDMIHGNKAMVEVKRPGKRVTLVLTSYEPMTWEITVGKDTLIEKVILCGRKRGAVKGLPDKTELVGAFPGGDRAELAVYTYEMKSPAFRLIVEALDREVGIPITSFTGAYRAEAGKPLVIDSVQKDELLSADFPKVVPAAKLPKLSFQANHYVAGGRPHELVVSFGEYTLGGPKANSLKPLPDRVSRITYDPGAKKYYGIADHGIAEVDLVKQETSEIDVGLNVPEISWPADVTYDTKRDRLLLVTSGGRGYLYAYHPKTKTAQVLNEKQAINAIAYHPKDDLIYAIRGDGKGELLHLNNQGAIVKTVKLDGPLVPGMLNLGPGVGGVQLVPADDKLVLLVAPVGLRNGEGRGPAWNYLYLVDPKTGMSELTWKSK